MILASTFTEQTLPLIIIAVCGALSLALIAIRYRRRSATTGVRADVAADRAAPEVPDLTAGL